MEEPQAKEIAKKPRPLWSALAIALFLIVLPGLLIGPTLVVAVVLWLFGAFPLSFRSKFAAFRNLRLRNLAIYLFASILVGVVYVYSLNNAQTRGQALVSAIQSFRVETGSYPRSLEELVPRYIDRIQPAAYGRFHYFNNAESGPFFFYVTLPPFGRRGYCFLGTTRCGLNIENPSTKEKWFDFD